MTRWLLAGASGFLGTALRVRLADEGNEVVRLVRREPATATEFAWDPDRGELDKRALEGVDVVVNLAGAGVADWWWTNKRRELILSSRVNTTATLASALADRAGTGEAPVLIQASGISVYGTEPSAEPHTEDSAAALDYLAQVVVHWEAATQAAVTAGVRVVILRTSPVMDRRGGPLQLMKLPWSFGLGAKLGDGQQWMPMIGLEDYLRVVCWAAANPDAAGVYNVTLPEPATNAEFTEALAAALRRPSFLAAPVFIVRTVLGELADQLVGDIHAVPDRLTREGFTFVAPDVRATIESALGRT